LQNHVLKWLNTHDQGARGLLATGQNEF